MDIKFGTDGWRAVIAEDFTFANLDRVAQATADYWSANPVPGTEKKIIVGYDRRFLSDEFGRRTRRKESGDHNRRLFFSPFLGQDLRSNNRPWPARRGRDLQR